MRKGTEALLIAVGIVAFLCSIAEATEIENRIVVGVNRPGREDPKDAEIWWWDEENEDWEKITADNSMIADQYSIDSFCVYQGQLYAGTGGKYGGCVFCYAGGTTWTQVGTTLGIGQVVTSLTVFGNDLLAGTSVSTTDYITPPQYCAVYRYDEGAGNWVAYLDSASYRLNHYAPEDPNNDAWIHGIAVMDVRFDPSTGRYVLYIGDDASDIIRSSDGTIIDYELDLLHGGDDPNTATSCVWDFAEYDGYYYAISELARLYVRVEAQNPSPPGNYDPSVTGQWYLALDFHGTWADKPHYHLEVFDGKLYAGDRTQFQRVDRVGGSPYVLSLTTIYTFDSPITGMLATGPYVYLCTENGKLWIYDGDTPEQISDPDIENFSKMFVGTCTKATLDVNSFTHTVDRDRILEPGSLQYSITYALSGTSTEPNIILALPEMSGLSLQVDSQVGVSSVPDIGSPTVSNNVLTWDLGELTSGTRSGTITIPVRVEDLTNVPRGAQLRSIAQVQDRGIVVADVVCDVVYSTDCIFVNANTSCPIIGQNGFSEETAFASLYDGLRTASDMLVPAVTVSPGDYYVQGGNSFTVCAGMTVETTGANLIGDSTGGAIITVEGQNERSVISGFTIKGKATSGSSYTGIGVEALGQGMLLSLCSCELEDLNEGVVLEGGVYTMDDCTVAHTSGFGIRYNGYSKPDGDNPDPEVDKDGTLALTGCTIRENSGTAISLEAGKVEISDCVIDDNKSNSGAPVVVQGGTVLTIAGSAFRNNQGNSAHALHLVSVADDSDITSCVFANNGKSNSDAWGTLRIDSGAVGIDNSWFVNNRAASGGAINAANGSLTLNDCSLSSNVADAGGGAVAAYDSPVTVRYCLFSGNRAEGSGSDGSAGGLGMWGGASLIAKSSVFTGNSADSSNGAGGAIYTEGAADITNCTFSDNSSCGLGGSVWLASGSFKNCILWKTGFVAENEAIISTWDEKEDLDDLTLHEAGVSVSHCIHIALLDPSDPNAIDENGNFGREPYFRTIASGSHHSYAVNSPAVDMGGDPGVFHPHDIEGNDRTIDIPGVGFDDDSPSDGVDWGTDIGAYELDPGRWYIYSDKYVYSRDSDDGVTIYYYRETGPNDTKPDPVIHIYAVKKGEEVYANMTEGAPGAQGSVFFDMDRFGGEDNFDIAYVARLHECNRNSEGAVEVGRSLAACGFFLDPVPPIPSPMQFGVPPYYDPNAGSITMTAVRAHGPNDVNDVLTNLRIPIEYRFVSDPNYGGASSAWQDERTYEVGDLELGGIYAYAVVARYKEHPELQTIRSGWEKVLTPGVIEVPETTSSKVQVCKIPVDPVRAYDAALDSNVRFYFENATTQSNSGWIGEPNWIDMNLTPATQYTYRMKMRFLSDTQTETGYSNQVTCSTFSAQAGDTTPPRPNPMTWAEVPHTTSDTSIAMVATEASDLTGPIRYYFKCVTDNTYDSNWVQTPSYEATGLTTGQEYAFAVKAKDGANNETGYSVTKAAFTDTDAPGDLQWGPAGVGYDVIQIRVSAVDVVGGQPDPNVPVYCEIECLTTGEKREISSRSLGWFNGQQYFTWTHTGLVQGHTYEYRFRAHDGHGNYSAWLGSFSRTTDVETTPPEPDPMQWADPCTPYVGNTMAVLQAVRAIPTNNWIDYEFECLNDPNHSSGWLLNSPTYVAKGLDPNTTYTFRVRARKNHRKDLVTGFSSQISFTTTETTSGVARIAETGAWFADIDDAIFEAADGQTVEIVPGTYEQTLDLTGREITLRSTDANDWDVVEETVIDGDGAAPVVVFGPHSKSRLEGLTITGADDPNALGGGVYVHTFGEASLVKCIVKDNVADYGAGVFGPAALEKCLLENNHATRYGGGAYNVLSMNGCELSYNVAGSSSGGGLTNGFGGGICGSDISLVNCILHDNASGTSGGGLQSSGDSKVKGCVFIDNSTNGDGGGLRHSYGDLTLLNCTFVDNDANDAGGGMYSISCAGPRVINCVFWGNTADSGSQIGGYLPYLYACAIEGATHSFSYIIESGGGPWTPVGYYKGGGFINTSPGFAVDGYHLSSSSVCIDVGLDSGDLPIADVDGHLRVMNSVVDIGADEYFVPDTTAPSPDPMTWAIQPAAIDSNSISMAATTATDASFPVVYYFECVTDPNHDSGWQLNSSYVDTGLVPQTTYTYHVRARDAAGNLTDWSTQAQATTQSEGPVYVAQNLSTEVWYMSIQDAIDAASNGDIIEIVEGTHVETVDFDGKDITLQGTDPNDWSVVEDTVISGLGTAPVVTFPAGSDSTLRGLTITGGNDPNVYGGGIWAYQLAHATISRCLIRDNTAMYGGGIYGGEETVVEECRIEDNHAEQCGGGTYGVGLTMTDCKVSGNSADGAGGGAAGSNLVLANCDFSENSANTRGGGLDCSNYSTVVGCVFYGNAVDGNGGGVSHWDDQLTLSNCTLRNNTAGGTGGGLYTTGCSGAEMTNCLLWGNTATSRNQIGGYLPYIHSCAVQGAYDGGYYINEQSTSESIGYDHGGQFVNTDPNFIDTFHLANDSVCIDKGQSVTGLPSTDIDGDDRTMHSGIEIGADEVANSTVPGPFGEELDTMSMAFTTGGAAGWFGETSTYYYDGDAAQSGAISDSQESWIQTTVSGTGTVTFWWKISSEQWYDFLEFYVDGTRRHYASGSVDWQQKSWTISTAGTHTLKWRYTKDSSSSSGSDCGWLDYVAFAP